MKQHGPWKILASEEVYRDSWITLTKNDVIRPDGEPGTFACARIKAGVAVLALDSAGVVYLAQEFRFAVGREMLEVCSGGLEPDEEPLAAAQRELKEELGIEAAEWTEVGVIDPIASIVVAPVRLFLARGLRIGEPAHESTEKIEIVKMTLREAVQAVLAGRITHAPSCVLLLRAALEQGRP
jgi:ADP-ribose pyrophosphatase